MGTALSGTLRFEQQGPVARLWLDRAERRNAIDHGMWQALAALLLDRRRWADVRVLVLSGSGAHFSAGADLHELAAHLDDRRWMLANQRQVQRAQQALQRLPCPTIAMIRGHCVGGGVGLATACDFRVCDYSARFALAPAKLGLTYSRADSARLVRLVGVAAARRLLFTGVAIDAEEAVRIGLVERCVSPDRLEAEVEQRISELLAVSGQALVAIKATLLEIEGGQYADDARTRRRFADALASADFAEAAAAFRAKRPPRIGGPR